VGEENGEHGTPIESGRGVSRVKALS
jgi:hypothetical protein